MLPSNIEAEVREILLTKGRDGWLRIGECEKEYVAKTKTGENKGTRRQKFYRFRKRVERKKVKDFQYISLPKNVAFIGLDSANPSSIESFVSEDKKLRSLKKSLGFFDWLEHRAERKQLEKEKFDLDLDLEACVLEHMFIMREGDWSPGIEAKLYKKCRRLLKDKYPSIVHEN